MKYLKILLILCIISTNVTAQNYQTVEEANDACEEGLNQNKRAENAINYILGFVDLRANFEIRICPNIKYVVSKNIADDADVFHRFLLINPDFLDRLKDWTQNDWEPLSILTHEISFYFSEYDTNTFSNPAILELEPDEFTGYVMANMKASLEDAKNTLNSNDDKSSPKLKADRLFKIEKGWQKGIIYYNNKAIKELGDICAPSINTTNKFQKEVEAILEQVGLTKNFKLQDCTKLNNVLAHKVLVYPNETILFLLYDSEFLEQINKKTKNNWASKSILAHEISHLLNGDLISNQSTSHKIELNADMFSGFILAKMGATLTDAQSAMQTVSDTYISEYHPNKIERLFAIEKGWEAAITLEKKK